MKVSMMMVKKSCRAKATAPVRVQRIARCNSKNEAKGAQSVYGEPRSARRRGAVMRPDAPRAPRGAAPHNRGAQCSI